MVDEIDDAHPAGSLCGEMIEITLSSDPAPDLLLLRFAASGEGDGLDASFHVEQSPITVDYQFPTDARELLEWVAELELLHASLEGVVVYPKIGPLQIAVSVGDRARGRLDVRASLWLEQAVRGSPPRALAAPPPQAAAFTGFVSDQSYLPLHTAALRTYLSTTGLSRRLEVVEVALGKVGSAEEMHAAFAGALGFPGFYGCNLDAFHDAITGLVVMPRTLILRGWQNLTQRLPREAAVVQRLLHDRASSPRGGFTIVFA